MIGLSSVDRVVRDLEIEVNDEVQRVNTQARSRAFRATNVMQGAAYDVLGKDGSGRVYKRGAKGVHTASVPGEAPAPDTGNLRRNWRRFVFSQPTGKGERITCRIKSDMPYAAALESGTSRMAARPFRQRIIDQAKPEIVSIFGEVR